MARESTLSVGQAEWQATRTKDDGTTEAGFRVYVAGGLGANPHPALALPEYGGDLFRRAVAHIGRHKRVALTQSEALG